MAFPRRGTTISEDGTRTGVLKGMFPLQGVTEPQARHEGETDFPSLGMLEGDVSPSMGYRPSCQGRPKGSAPGKAGH